MKTVPKIARNALPATGTRRGWRWRDSFHPSLVSGTVKDLVAGSGIYFHERGVAELEGIPGEWRLYSVDQSTAVA